MGLFGTMFVGYTGLYSDSIATKVSADNITNLNTTGFKGSRTEFADKLVRYSEVFGKERGYGTSVKQIRTLFTQGSVYTTDLPTDLAISGKGFFIVSDKKNNFYYTRDGQFYINEVDENHFGLQNSLGMNLLGISPELTHPTIGDLKPTLIPKVMPPKATSLLKPHIILDATKPVNSYSSVAQYDASANPEKPLPDGYYNWVFDLDFYTTQGHLEKLKLYLDRGETADSYEVLLALSNPSQDGRGQGPKQGAFLYGTLKFGASGEITEANFYQVGLDGTLTPLDLTQLGKPLANLNLNGVEQPVTLDLGFKINPDGSLIREINAINMLAHPFTLLGYYQDGYGMGVFDKIEVINEEGLIIAKYTNQRDIKVAKIVLADFSAYEDTLQKLGNGLFVPRAGAEVYLFLPGFSEGGRIISGALENSNVDLAMEMVHLIVLQRSFQSNSRVITTADAMLEDFLRQV